MKRILLSTVFCCFTLTAYAGQPPAPVQSVAGLVGTPTSAQIAAALAGQSFTNPTITGSTISGGSLSGMSIGNGTVISPSTPSATPTLLQLLADEGLVRLFGVKCDGTTDDTSAFNAMLAITGFIQAPAGTCIISNSLNISQNNSVIQGVGSSQTIIKSTSTTAPILSVSPGLGQLTIRDMMLDRSATPSAGANGITDPGGGNATIENVISQDQYYGFALGGISLGQLVNDVAVNNYSDGFHITNSSTYSTLQWALSNTESEGNNGWGYNVVSGTNAGTGPMLPWIGAETYANTLGGVAFHGQSSAPIYDITINAGLFSTDGGDEMYFDTYGGNIKVVGGTYAELAGTSPTGRNFATTASHTGRGINVSGNVGDIQVDGDFLSFNSLDGADTSAYRSLFVGNVLQQNGSASPGTYTGVSFLSGTSGTTAVAVGNRSGNLNNSTPQATGFAFINGIGSSAIGNDLSFNSGLGLNVATNASALTAYGNLGFVVNGSGVSNIPANATSVVVSHGLSIAPTQVFITPNTYQGTGQIWVDTITSTTFTVHISTASSSLVGFAWSAKVFNN